MDKKLIYLVRHGDYDSVTESLNVDGIEQIKATANYLKERLHR